MANIAPYIEALSTVILQPPAFVHNLHTVTEELVVVDKFDYVIKMRRGTIRQYYITPQGWTSSLEVPYQAFMRLFIGDVIVATYNPLTRTAVGIEHVGKVPPGTELHSMAPDFKTLEKNNRKTIFLAVGITTSILSLISPLMIAMNWNSPEDRTGTIQFFVAVIAITLYCIYQYRKSR